MTLLTLRGDDRAPNLHPGVKHRPLKVLDDNYLGRALTFQRLVGQALYAERPDVVHVRGPFEGQAALHYTADRKTAFVFEVNGLPSVELRYHHPRAAQAHDFLRKLRAQEQVLLRQADMLLTQSEATARFIRLRAQSQVTPHVIPNGADPALFRASPRNTDGPIELLYSGSLAPWQGLLGLLSALRQARRHGDFRLTVLGPPRRSWIRAINRCAKSLKVQDILHTSEAGGLETVAEHLENSDICVAPLARDTRNRIQGCSPIKVFEYMAAGRTVLASDLPCVREIVQPCETGYLHKASNVHRLREALLYLAGAPRLRSELGVRARNWIVEHATWSRRHAQLGEAYEALLARASA